MAMAVNVSAVETPHAILVNIYAEGIHLVLAILNGFLDEHLKYFRGV